MTQIFLSHSSSESALAQQFRQELLAARPAYKVFLSSEYGAGPLGGSSWRSWIRNSITNCDLVLFLATKQSHSVWCSAELGMARLLDKPILPVHDCATVDLNPVVGDLQAVPLDQPVESIATLIDSRLGSRSSTHSLDDDFVPYPGLEPLGEHEAALLFGRSTEARQILRDFDPSGSARVVMLSGPSGSGKSSLARAGIVPVLRDEGWTICGPTQPQLLANEGLPEVTVRRPEVIVVDQAEELMLLDDDHRAEIVAWLCQAVETGTWVLVVVRSEFRPEVGLLLPKPIDHYIPFLGRDELYEIVRGPAKLANLGIAETLVDRLVGETGTGEALPLLALTLHELWKQRDTTHNKLTTQALDDLGGVEGVMRRLAEEALASATEGDPLLVDPVLATLTLLATPERLPPTRSPRGVKTMTDDQRRWLDAFADVGLVSYRTSYALDDRLDVGVRPSGDDLVDVSHEALFEWAPLAAAIAGERARNIERESIERTANEWDKAGRADSSLLAAGDRLKFAQREGLGAHDPVIRSYVAASKKHDRDRRVRRVLVGAVSVASLLAMAAAVLAFNARGQANDDRDLARSAEAEAQVERSRAEEAEVAAQSLRIAAVSNDAITNRRDFALLAAVAAYRTAQNAGTEGALINALATPVGPLRYFSDDSAMWSTLRMLDEDRGLVATDERRAAVVDFETGSLTSLAQGSALDEVQIAAIERIGLSQRVLFRGRRSGSVWVVGILDLATDELAIVDHDVEIRAAAATANTLAFGDFDGGVYAAEYRSGALGPALLIDRHQAEVTDIDVVADDSWLAAASVTGVRIQSASATGWSDAVDLLSVAPGERNVDNIAFRQDTAGELYGAGSDPRIRRWRLESGQFREAENVGTHLGVVESLVVWPDQGILLTAGLGGSIQRWLLDSDVPVGESLETHGRDIGGLSTLGAGRFVSTDAESAILWDLGSGRPVERAGVVPPAWEDEFIDTLVLGAGPLAVVTNDNRVLVADGRQFEAPSDIWRAWWAGEDLVFEVRDLAQLSGGAVKVWTLVDDALTEIATEVDAVDVGSCLGALADGDTIEFIDLGGCGAPPQPIMVEDEAGAQRDPVVLLSMSPDEQRLLVAYRGGRLEEFDIVGGDLVDSLMSNQTTVATALGWITSRTVVVGHDRGGTSEIIDLDGGGVQEIDVHDDAVRWMAAGDSGERLFLGGEDGRISHTSTSTGAQVGSPLTARRRSTLNDPEATIRGLELSEEDNVLLAVQGFQVTAWELDVERLIDMACDRAGRSLTAAESSSIGAGDLDDLC